MFCQIYSLSILCLFDAIINVIILLKIYFIFREREREFEQEELQGENF